MLGLFFSRQLHIGASRTREPRVVEITNFDRAGARLSSIKAALAGRGDCPSGLGAEPAGTKHASQEKGGATGAVGRERGRGLTALLRGRGRDHASGPRGRDGVTCVHSPRGVRAVSSTASCKPSCPPAAGERAAAQRAVSGARGGEPLVLRPGREGTAPSCAGWAPGAGCTVLNPRRAVDLLPA